MISQLLRIGLTCEEVQQLSNREHRHQSRSQRVFDIGWICIEMCTLWLGEFCSQMLYETVALGLVLSSLLCCVGSCVFS